MQWILFLLCFFMIMTGITVLGLSIIGIYLFISSRGFLIPPPVPTSGRIKKALLDDISKTLKNSKGKIVVDLGSGWGTLLIPLAQAFPNHTFIGVELAYLPLLFSKWKGRHLNNIRFYQQNLFSFPLSKADILIVFLLPSLMPALTKKCAKESKKGALIYSNRFPLQRTPVQKISFGSNFETVYKYKI